MTLLAVPINVLLFILGAGVLQAILLVSLLLFHHRSEKSSNKYLAIYILCVSFPMMMPLVQHLFSWQYMLLLDPFPFLIGPTMYFYVRSFMERLTWKKVWPHLIIFFLCVISDYTFFFKVMELYPPGHVIPPTIPTELPTLITINLRIVVLVTYIVLSFKKLGQYQSSINKVFSDTSKINIAWVKWLISGFVVIIIILIIGWTIMLRKPELNNAIVLFNTIMITPYIYIATIKGLFQPTIWTYKTDTEAATLEATLTEVSNASTDAQPQKNTSRDKNSQRTEEVSRRLIQLIETDKLYQEPELTLQDIADKLSLPSYQVSQVINEGLNKSFYDLINGYRVEEAKRLLQDPKSRNYTILAVGFEAGFNSKTTFNTVFKKFTGKTPTDYRDSLMASRLTSGV